MRLFVLLSLFCFSVPTLCFSVLGEESHCDCGCGVCHLSDFERYTLQYAKYYELPAGVDFAEITDEVSISPFLEFAEREAIQDYGRRFFVFNYPSDGLKVRALISITEEPENQPVVVLLRGGNGCFGLINPASDLLCTGKATVVTTAYRGGISEGKDEFGGADVNDVRNLISFLPTLAKKFNVSTANTKIHLVGLGRGAMQMFLALARFPKLQARISKIVSYGGLLDVRESIHSRPELKQMFIDEFGLEEGVNDEAWINQRDPLLTTDAISKDLPILLIQGTEDDRVSPVQARTMFDQLTTSGHNVSYLEVEGGSSSLMNGDHVISSIMAWLLQ